MKRFADPSRSLAEAVTPSGPEASRTPVARALEDDLLAVAALVARMGGRAEELLAAALRAAERREAALAQAADAEARALEATGRRLAALATGILARRAPVAGDLRALLAALRIAASLERVGGLARNIAVRGAALEVPPGRDDLDAATLRLGRRALGQLGEALSAHQAGDAERARAVVRRDAALDALFESLSAALVRRMAEAPEAVAAGVPRLFLVKDLERIGDHAAGIARAAHFRVTGVEIDDA